MSTLFAVTRAVHFASLMTVFGACAFSHLANLGDAPLKKTLSWAALTALVSAVLCLFFTTAEMTGSPTAAFDIGNFAAVVAHTTYGNTFLVRLALLTATFLLCLADARPLTRALVAGLALALLGLTSHAAASGPPRTEYWRAANDAVHLLAAGFWTGGLVALLPALLAKPRDTAMIVSRLRRFSAFGALAVATLVLAGTANGIFILGVLGMRWSGTYVTWLAVKLVLAGLMIAIALTNRFGLLPALTRGDAEAADTIPLSIIAELSCAALILLAVGFLGVTAPMEM